MFNFAPKTAAGLAHYIYRVCNNRRAPTRIPIMIHPINLNAEPPQRFTYPFCYTPHPLAVWAAEDLQRRIARHQEWHRELLGGKMFGVLVVGLPGGYGGRGGRTGYLAAFSGLLGGTNTIEGFVPPVFNLLNPGGYFKQREALISRINTAVRQREESAERQVLSGEVEMLRRQAGLEIDLHRQKMELARLQRHLRYEESGLRTEADDRESKFMKAELRRIKKRRAADIAAAEQRLSAYDSRTNRMKSLRRRLSDALQRWIFTQYTVLDALGRERTLADIFARTPAGVPPSGAGECCAPKLLQYAYRHGLKPLCMAEFWWGESPKAEVRHHLHYYPACRGKCLPILGHMLAGLSVDADPLAATVAASLRVVYHDRWLMVVDKPAGMLSVRGNTGRLSVQDIVERMCPDAPAPMPAHRLDMDTSGLLVVAKDRQTLAALQRQFERREVQKRYVALLMADISGRVPAEGEISLPLRPDPADPPRQIVCRASGLPALTRYRIAGSRDGRTQIELMPVTGRTHQLRLHCAHADGLAAPILGDPLYGTPGDRLCLHAAAIRFVHPVTGRTMEFESPAGF